MRTPEDLYDLLTDRTDLGRPVMLHSLAGFLDAGSAGRIGVVHLLDTLTHSTVAEFDIDELYDYRARRPPMTFLTDHYGEIDLPRLAVSELKDDVGRTFLLLHGPEPDFAWQRFAAAVTSLVRRFDVSLVVGMHAVPFPAPHTRPIGVTAHSADPALVAGRVPWVGDLQVPGHVAGLLEIQLGEAGLPAMGFAAHVPHYVAGGEYPGAAVTLLESVMSQTGLVLPLDALREAARATDLDLDLQVQSSSENTEAVRLLEQQYEQVSGTRGSAIPAQDQGAGDDIAAQVERFLAQRDATGGRDDA